MGFPGRTSYDELGGTRENAPTIGKVTNPKQQLGFEWTNEVQGQVAGMNAVCPLVTLTVDASGNRLSGGEAWNWDQDVAKRVSITKAGTGVYEIEAQAAEYPDWGGVNRPVVFYGALITVLSATSVRPATYTLDSATKITVYTWDAAGVAADLPFTVDIK